ncbi:MAG: hypothetical protein J7L47_04565 [Candidatus Odinarchaeota archaeon]|nr:hypothetical protein [Candidatus Odinarchaeota archaeon]
MKGLFDCLNYLMYKILPRVKSIDDLKRELARLEVVIREENAEVLERKILIL